MYGYLFNGFFGSEKEILGGSAEGLFQNRHIKDLLQEGHKPAEIDYMDGEERRRWCWKEGDPELLDPQNHFPVRWRENNKGQLISYTIFMGTIFSYKEWRKATVGRRRSRKYTARVLVREASFTYLLHQRIELCHCRVAKLLAEELRVATIDLPELRERWDGRLVLLKVALDWYGWPYRQWKEGALPPEWQWQNFWEWWAEHIHPRL